MIRNYRPPLPPNPPGKRIIKEDILGELKEYKLKNICEIYLQLIVILLSLILICQTIIIWRIVK
jgi:hypothetical protein